MEKWRGKWATDDNEDSLPWDKQGINGVPQNSQYESSIKAARKAAREAVSNPTQDKEELIKQFETFISKVIAWRAKWVEDYPNDNDPLTDAIREAHAAVVKVNEN